MHSLLVYYASSANVRSEQILRLLECYKSLVNVISGTAGTAAHPVTIGKAISYQQIAELAFMLTAVIASTLCNTLQGKGLWSQDDTVTQK